MKLRDVYDWPEAVDVLYRLLQERTAEQSISHKSMPAMEEHRRFVESIPYRYWFIITNGADTPVGATYLTREREVGLFIFKHHHGKGYGTWAVKELLRRYPGPCLANVSPRNSKALAFWAKFGRLAQFTYEIANG